MEVRVLTTCARDYLTWRDKGNPSASAALGGNGREYFAREYSWPVIERKYLEMFDFLKSTPASYVSERLSRWLRRRRRNVPPARDVLAALPAGTASRERHADADFPLAMPERDAT